VHGMKPNLKSKWWK